MSRARVAFTAKLPVPAARQFVRAAQRGGAAAGPGILEFNKAKENKRKSHVHEREYSRFATGE